MKFLDVSGFGHSGKTVVADILKEIVGYQLPDYNFEFNLIRIQGGLLDLKSALVDNWSPIRSDSAIKRFINLVNRIGPKASIYVPSSLFLSNGMNYDSMFSEKFTKLSHDYISDLISITYEGYWPYSMIDRPIQEQFFSRLKGQFGISPKLVNIYLSDSSDFQLKTINYLTALFRTIKKENTDVFVLLNSLEPFNSEVGLNLLGDAKQIVVTRDPRDIYVSAMNVNRGFIPDFELKYMGLKRNIVGNDLDIFINRHLIYHKNVVNYTSSDRILWFNYEELILNYEESLNKIYDFVGVCPSKHINKGKYFDPKKSVANVGLWKNFDDKLAIAKIEEALYQYCWHN